MIHMNKVLLKGAALSLLAAATLVGCKKDDTPDPNATIDLRGKSVAEAKAIMAGNWKLHYRLSGLNGTTRTNLPNSNFRLLANDSIYLTLNDELVAEDKATFERGATVFGHTAVKMAFESVDEEALTWVADKKKGDTLVLVTNATESDAYYMTRVQ